jgi:alkane 1-monooxygenase
MTAALRYSLPLALAGLAQGSFVVGGSVTWAVPILMFVISPVVEQALRSYWTPAALDDTRGNRFVARGLLWISAAALLSTIAVFVGTASSLSYVALAGASLTLGLEIAVLGIIVAHELGHGTTAERFLADALLILCGCPEFKASHPIHHAFLATLRDPSCARPAESAFRFIIRSTFALHRLAWPRRPGVMAGGVLVPLGICVFISVQSGYAVAIAYASSVVIAVCLLALINYIQHWGLSRDEGEKLTASCSWNCEFPLSRLFMFELPRHADHHVDGRKSFHLLKPAAGAWQMPAGYPAMLILALIPPLWFRVMTPRLRAR